MKKSKIFLSVLILITATLLLVPINASADIVGATATWTQPDIDNVDYWILYWGATSGGPYGVGSVTIQKSDLIGGVTKKDINVDFPVGVTAYYFVIVAFNAEGNSADSNEFLFSTGVTPQAPTALQVTPR